MSSATITSKGQVTIPSSIRRRMGLSAGDRVEFVELPSGEFAILPAVDDIRFLKGILKSPARPVSIDDMRAAVRERARQ